MLATVTYPYRDRETFAVHLPGDEVELTEARFAELSAGGYVDAPPASACEPECTHEPGAGGVAAPAPAEDAAPAADAQPDEGPEPAPQAAEQTKDQIRAQIEAKGGFAPKKATKEQLVGILESL